MSQDNDKPSAQPTPEEPNSEQSTDAIATASSESPLPSRIAFLQERIRTLEREKQEEAVRAEKREARLFDQLAVKDKQINSWDEITQGLTRGLATGRLVPSLLGSRSDSAPDRPTSDMADSQSRSLQDAKLVEHQSTTKPKRTTKKRAAKTKPKSRQKRSKSVFEKHTPTFHKLASGLLRRS